MKQSEAVQAIYSLLPRMKDEQPEEVISKYASRRKLAPAQLERLGHVFNTATTLTTLDKDRDAAPYLIDVPKMTSSYIQTEGRSKKASWLDDAAPTESEGIDKSASAQLRELPSPWAVKTPGIEVRLADTTDLGPVRKQMFYKAAALASRACEEEIMAVGDFDNAIAKIARAMSRDVNPSLSYATLLADARGLGCDDATEHAAVKLAGAFASHGIDVHASNAKPQEFVLARDRTGHYSNLCAAADHLKTAVDRHATLSQALEYAVAAGRTLASDTVIVSAARKCATDITNFLDVGGLFKSAEPARDQKKTTPVDRDLGIGSYVDEIQAINDHAVKGEEGGEFRRMLSPTLGMAVQGTRGALSGLGGVAQRAPGFVREFTPEGTFGQLFAETAEANRQKADGHKLDRDRIAEDARSLGTLKGLMMRDEILATKDPERVIEAFNTIRMAAPEVASDPSMLRLLLRQAMETQGVDIDTATAARKFEHGSYKKDTYTTPPQQHK